MDKNKSSKYKKAFEDGAKVGVGRGIAIGIAITLLFNWAIKMLML